MEIFFFVHSSFYLQHFFHIINKKNLSLFHFFNQTHFKKFPLNFSHCIRNSGVEVIFKIIKSDGFYKPNKQKLQKDFGSILTGPQFALDYCPLFEGHFLCDVMIIGRAA